MENLQQEEPDGSPPCRMNRVLSFSNGIASACRNSVDECGSSGGDDENSEFSFRRNDQAYRKLYDTESKPDFLTITITDEEFEREFGDSEGYQHPGPEKLPFDGGTASSSGDEAPLLRTVVSTLFYVLLWYIFSTCLTVYNKKLLGKKYGQFPAPLLMNTIHFSMQAIVSKLLLCFWCPALAPTRVTWRDYFLRVVPTGVATALDVDLTNTSLVFITVTFATMCKSATPVFLLFFAFLFKLETPSLKLFGIISLISSGVLLTVAKETQFILLGFILVILAAASSGFRWVFTQLLLQREEYGLNNPLAAMSCFTPIMAGVTAIFSMILEPWSELGKTEYFNTKAHFGESCLLMLLGGTLAFFMVMAEYLLISKTSAVTMTVAGVVKEVVTVVVAILYFGDEFTVLKGIGFLVIVVGVSLFNWYKYQALVHGKDERKAGGEGIEFSTRKVQYVILEDENQDSFVQKT